MTVIKSLHATAFAMFVFGCVEATAAQGPVTNASTTTAELQMSANVETALQLNISTGSGGATVSGSNATVLFSVNFGSVNGFGIGTPAAGVSVVADGTGATYSTPINLTPVYSGFTSGSCRKLAVSERAFAFKQLFRALL